VVMSCQDCFRRHGVVRVVVLFVGVPLSFNRAIRKPRNLSLRGPACFTGSGCPKTTMPVVFARFVSGGCCSILAAAEP